MTSTDQHHASLPPLRRPRRSERPGIHRAAVRDAALAGGRIRRTEFDALWDWSGGDPVAVIDSLARVDALTEDDRIGLLAQTSGMERSAVPRNHAPELSSDAHEAVRGRWLPIQHTGAGAVVAVDAVPSDGTVRELERTLGELDKVVLVTPSELDDGLSRAIAAKASVERARLDPGLSAHRGVRPWQFAVLSAILTAVAGAGIAAPQGFVLVLWCAALGAAALSVLFRLLAALLSPGSARTARARPALRDSALPGYTVVVPAFAEPEVLPETLRWLAGLDYPADRLQLLVMLEEGDAATIEAVRALELPETVTVRVVPDGEPRTKPRACNAALPYATGELLVVFDAEDRPERDQLRRAAEFFREDDRRGGRTACVQARLHYYNVRQNLLTRAFALEYAAWFDGMLPGLARMRIPFPLGGTSNHFRTGVLRELGGWDAFNVTEDADLGFRLWSAGYTADVLDSTTWEEACSRVRPWVRQRTRWIKGYMMTGAVYTRSLRRMWSELGVRGTASIAGLVLGTPIAFLAYPVLLLLMLVGPLLPVEGVGATGSVLVAGYALAGIVALVTFVAGRARYGLGTALLAVLHPVYWLLHAVAAWRAAVQIIRRPFVWEKTPHGLCETPGPAKRSRPPA